MNKQIFSKKQTEAGLKLNPKEWPRVMAFIFSMVVICYLAYTGFVTEFKFDPYHNIFAFIPLSVTRICAYSSLIILISIAIGLNFYSFTKLLKNRKDYILLKEDALLFFNNNLATEMKIAEQKSVVISASGELIKFISTDDKENLFHFKDFNFYGSALDEVFVELKSKYPSLIKKETAPEEEKTNN